MQTSKRDDILAPDPSTSRLSAFGSLEGAELNGLTKLAGPERLLHRGDILWEQGKRLPALFLLLDGWMISRMRVSADRDLATRVYLPGDVLGLPSVAFSLAAETSASLTSSRLRPLALHSLGNLFEAHPRVAAMMFLVSQQERMSLTDRLASISTASVAQRLAAFVVQLLERVQRSFLEAADSVSLPITRQDVADMIGTDLPQLAAALKHLREQNILGWTNKLLTVADVPALKVIAGLPIRLLAQDAHWLPLVGPAPE